MIFSFYKFLVYNEVPIENTMLIDYFTTCQDSQVSQTVNLTNYYPISAIKLTMRASRLSITNPDHLDIQANYTIVQTANVTMHNLPLKLQNISKLLEIKGSQNHQPLRHSLISIQISKDLTQALYSGKQLYKQAFKFVWFSKLLKLQDEKPTHLGYKLEMHVNFD